jgi:hypothetical protein
MLSRALDTHADLSNPKDGEWIHTLLAFLKAYIDNAGEKWLMHNDSRTEYISNLVGDLKEAAGKLDSGDEPYLMCIPKHHSYRALLSVSLHRSPCDKRAGFTRCKDSRGRRWLAP